MSDFEPYVESDWENAYRLSEQERSEERRDVQVEPDWRPQKRVKKAKAPRADWSWKQAVLERDQGCIRHTNPADCREGIACHHAVTQQELRKQGLAWAIKHPLMGVTLCGLAHRQHHSRVRPLFMDELPAQVVDFVRAQGMGYWLDRTYPLRHSDDGDVTQAAA